MPVARPSSTSTTWLVGKLGERAIASVEGDLAAQLPEGLFNQRGQELGSRYEGGGEMGHHWLVQAFGHRPDAELLVTGCTYLASDECLQWRAEQSGDFGGYGDAASGEAQDDRRFEVQRLHPLGQLAPGIGAVLEARRSNRIHRDPPPCATSICRDTACTIARLPDPPGGKPDDRPRWFIAHRLGISFGTTRPDESRIDRRVKMPVHTDIKVLPLDSETCEVIAVEGLLTTRHRVAVPPAQLELIHLCDRDMAAVVHETFVMALEREPATALPAAATLEAIGNRYPDFWAELRGRLASPSRGRRREGLDDPAEAGALGN